MAEFCKIREDGSVQNAPNPLKISVSNPTDARYRYEGFLEKQYAAQPAYNPETQYLAENWVQSGAYAVQQWIVCDIPAPESGNSPAAE